ncbi:MAG: hypothetical protein WC061_05650, partial [Melioribacteraceae bacterium]
MKNKLLVSIIAAILLNIVSVNAQISSVGKKYPAERKTWVDDSTKFEISQLTNKGRNWHLYFNIESFIDDDNIIIFSTRSGRTNLFRMNLIDGTMTQMTDETDLKQNVWHYPSQKQLLYFNADTLKILNTDNLTNSVFFVFDTLKPESFAVTCDGKWLVYSANRNPGFTVNHSTGPYALFKMEFATKKIFQISPDYGFKMSHVQTSPVDPALISYCWQHQYRPEGEGIVGNTPVRIWWNHIDGLKGGPVVPQELGLPRT